MMELRDIGVSFDNIVSVTVDRRREASLPFRKCRGFCVV